MKKLRYINIYVLTLSSSTYLIGGEFTFCYRAKNFNSNQLIVLIGSSSLKILIKGNL